MKEPRLALGAVLTSLLLTVAALSGCERSDAGPSAESSVWEDDGWQLSAEPILTIGSVDGPEAIGSVASPFADASAVALFEDGRIAMAEGQADEIRIYDASGNRLATIGRSGDGPGEFRGLAGIRLFADDSLLAWDSRGFRVGRLSVFAPGGAFVRASPAPRPWTRALIGVGEDGSTLVQPQASAPADWVEPTTGEFREPTLYQRLSASGEALNTIGPFPGPDRVADPATRAALVFFARDTHVAVGKRVIYSGDSGGFEILVHDPATGNVLRTIRRPWELRPVSPEQLSSVRESMRTAYARSDSMMAARMGAAMLERTRQSRSDPDATPGRPTHPAFNRIVEDSDENLWVQHAAVAADTLSTWSVFGREGSWLGEVGIPARLLVQAIGSDKIAGVTFDDLGVQYVQVFRLIK